MPQAGAKHNSRRMDRENKDTQRTGQTRREDFLWRGSNKTEWTKRQAKPLRVFKDGKAVTQGGTARV